MLKRYVLAVAILLLLFGVDEYKAEEVGDSCSHASYSTCNLGKEGMINVHVVPHTHDDVGWLKTVDQYYYGSNTKEQEASVQYILDNVVAELARDPSKRFVYVEMAFFWRWWNEQNDETKQLVRMLVDENRLEFVIGAWCMNDEASPYYQDIIDQQTLGLQFILKEFGECARPRVAWQIDPFGHSREQASLFAQFGFDGLFQGRIDYQDSDYRDQEKSREMVWKASANLGVSGTIFTGILPNTYNPPDGFCFDTYCSDDPIMDNPNLEDYNVNDKVDLFIFETMEQLKRYKSNNLIMTMGSDFQFSNARMWYKNLDKLIYYVNQRQLNGSQVNIFYSTPSCYLYSLYKSNLTWPEKTDDFFPYAHRPHSFWTGYFTSRTTLKDYVRRTNNFLQAVRHLSVFSHLTDAYTQEALGTLTRAMGVAQHHDAVSGTERQHVAFDYAKRLAKGTNMCVEVMNEAYSKLVLTKYARNIELKASYCPLLNISQCVPIEHAKNISLIVYNPLAQAIKYWIRLPVGDTNYVVYDLNEPGIIPSEFVEVPEETKSIPERNTSANYEALFKVNLEPLAFKSIVLLSPQRRRISLFRPMRDINKLKNQHLEVLFDSNGNMQTINNIDTVITSQVKLNFCYYKSMPGNNSKSEFQASGAYIFRPDGDPICLQVKSFQFAQGKQYSEVNLVYNSFISCIIRLYDDANSLEFNWQVGSIDVSDGVGKEIVVKFETDLSSNRIFYTDANGREILQRTRDLRPSWPNFNQTEKIAGNYYPINSRIFIRDEPNGRQFTLVTDRTHGGSSIKDGEVEVMLHRRILNDDALGVSEPLNEKGSDSRGLIAKGRFFAFLNTTRNSARLHRESAHRVNTQPLITVGLPKNDTNIEFLKRLGDLKTVSGALPPNVHLLTLMHDFDNEEDNALLLRLEHFYELDEDPELSQPVTIDLHEWFNGVFNLLGIEELSLGANMRASDLNQRLRFNSFSNDETLTSNTIRTFKSSFQVTLNPMEIKTYRIWYQV